MSKKITRLASNGKPYAGVLSEFVTVDESKLLVDEHDKEVLSEERPKKSRKKKKQNEDI